MHKLMMKISGMVLLLILALVLGACSSFSLAEDITPPPGASMPVDQPTQEVVSGPQYPLAPPDPANGQQIYAEKCAPCHGADGRGDGPQASELPNPPAAIGTAELARQSTPSEWYSIITQGDLERFMPPFSNSLNERQRWDVVAYVYTLSAAPGTLTQGAELYEANCATCHGAEGKGDGPEAAGLAIAPTDFTRQAFMAEKPTSSLFQAISEGVPPDMPAFADELGEEERWALAAYLRSLTFATPGETAVLQNTPVATEGAAQQATGAVEGTPQTTAVAQATGTVSGQVVNSSGGEIPDDLTITLHGFDQMQETITLSTTVQSDGNFGFEGVEMPAGRAFIASLEYDETIYGSDIAVVEEESSELKLVVPIYETTTNAEVLSVDRLHIFFEYQEPDSLRVVELYVISNLSDRTLVAPAEGEPVVSFDVPAEAVNLQFEEGSLGGRFIKTPSGFGDTAVVRPGMGQHQVVFAYDLPYQRKLDLTHPVNMPVNAVVVLAPEDGLKLKSEQLQDAGSRDVQGVAYHMYTSERMEAGADLTISISGRPSGDGLGLVSGSSTSLVIGLAAFGLALVVAGVWLWKRAGGRGSGGVGELGREGAGERGSWGAGEQGGGGAGEQGGGGAGEGLKGEDAEEEREALMDAIIALDDMYQAGELPEEAYRERRAELKGRLKRLGS